MTGPCPHREDELECEACTRTAEAYRQMLRNVHEAVDNRRVLGVQSHSAPVFDIERNVTAREMTVTFRYTYPL